MMALNNHEYIKLFFLKDKGHPVYTYPFHSTTSVTVVTEGSRYDNGPLIGGIIGGILGLLLLLALILLLVWCCCIRRRKKKDTQIKFYNQQNLTSQSVVSGYPTENNIEITQDGWRNMNGYENYLYTVVELKRRYF